MTPQLQKELGIDHLPDERKQRIFDLYDDVVKLARQHEELLRLVRISMMSEAELLQFRSELAAKGLEWTPTEAKMVQRVIKIVLKHM